MASKISGLVEKISIDNVAHSLASTAYGYCETAAGTQIKNVEMTGFQLIEGITVHIKFANNNTASNPKLKFNSEADANAKPIVQYGTTAAGTTAQTNGWYSGAVLTLTYDGTSWVRDQGFNTNDNTIPSHLYHYNNIKARQAITAESLIVGDSTGFEKVGSGVTFDLSYPIVWCTGAVEQNKTNYANMYLCHYDKNIATGAKSGFTSTANKVIYLIVTIAGNIATIDSNIITDTLPSTEDNKVYIVLGKLGAQSTGANYFFLYPEHPMFWYKNGEIEPYMGAVVKQSGITTDANYPVLFKQNANTTDEYSGINYSNSSDKTYTFNPNSGQLNVAQLKISIKNDNYGLFPHTNNYNQIGSGSLYWYRAYITNYYGSRSSITNWDAGKNIGTAATSSAAATKGSVYFYNVAAANTTQTKTLLQANDNTNSNITITLPSSTGTLALTSALDNYLLLTGGTMTGDIKGNAAVALGTVANPFHNIVLGGTTTTTMTADSTNPRITFQESNNGVQQVHLIYGDADSYRAPAGLKIIGEATSGDLASPAWLEVEGDIIGGRNLTVNGTGTFSTASPSLIIKATGSNAVTLALERNNLSSWKWMNSGGSLALYNNWTTSSTATEYFPVVTYYHSTGNITINKGDLTLKNNPTSDMHAATKAYVDSILAANNAMIFKGTIDSTNGSDAADSTNRKTLPATHNAGDTYRVAKEGTYAGKYCEIGTLIICTTDGTAANDAHWTSVETNEDGAVIGPTSSTENSLAFFSSASGRVLDGTGTYVKYLNHIAANAGTNKAGYIDGIHITGAAYGEAANLISNTAGLMSYGDAGPQIRFTCSGQNGAMIFNHYDNTTPSSTFAASFNFVTDQATGVALKSDGFIINGTTTWLRDNSLTFSQGGGWAMSDSTWIRTVGNKSVYMNTGTFRNDGTTLLRLLHHVNTNITADGTWETGGTGTDNSGDNYATRGTLGTSVLSIGNAIARPAAGTAGGKNNSKGYLRIYGEGTGYGELSYNDSMFASNKSIYLTNTTNNGISNEIRGLTATNDYWRIAGGATASNAGYMEIATGDDYNEPIYVRQYSGAFVTVKRTATLLDASGNTEFPVQVTAPKFIGALEGNADTATTATNLSAKPSLAASENSITVTAGGKTSDAFTVPYATNAGSATTATMLSGSSITTEDSIESGTRVYMGSGSGWTGSITSMQYAGILQVYGGYSRGWQIWAKRGDSQSLHWRNPNDAANAWNEEKIILDSGNYTNYTVTKTGTGASGTWGISITGSSASCTGNAATAAAIQTAGTTAQFYRGDNSWSNIIKQTANTTLSIDANLKIGTARKDLNFDIATGTGTGINDGYAGGITWGTGTAAHAGIYCQTSGSYGTRLIFGTTGSYANGAYARMIIQSNGKVGIGTLSPDALLTVNGNGKFTGQIITSFKSSIAPGSYGSAQTTIPDLLEEVRYSSGCMGSFNLTTAYTLNNVTLAAGWYNFMYIPHRNGGLNGAAQGDNCDYGALYLHRMNAAGYADYVLAYSSQAAKLLDLHASFQSAVTDGEIIIADGTLGHIKTSGYTTSSFATADHTHNYAGSSSAGGAANSAVRINGNLGALTDTSSHNIWVSSTNSADGIPKYVTGVYVTASTGVITAKGFSGPLSGNATTATAATAINFTASNELILGNADGQAKIYINHRRVINGQTSGNTAITDYYFRNGNASESGVTIHADSFSGNAATASKISAKLVTNKKIYFLGTETTITSTAANVSLEGDTGVYLTTTAGELSAARHSWNVSGTEKAYTIYNTTDDSIDFVFI